jgi:hypothetical protein
MSFDPDFQPRSTGQGRVCAFRLGERRMKCTTAIKFHRKSGGAKRRGLRLTRSGTKSQHLPRKLDL